MALTNKLKTALKRISLSGGTVRGLASGIPFATDHTGKIIPSTTLQELVDQRYLFRHTSRGTSMWTLTTLGQAAITMPVAAKPRSAKNKPATAAPAPKRDWKAAVREIMRSSGFDEEDDGENRLSYATRDNGDMENDRAGAADIARARDLRSRIEKTVPGATARVGTVDEWTSLSITHGGS